MEQDRSIAVIGLGYVGLPLALGFTEAGVRVTGVDSSELRVAELNEGHSPIEDISDERLGAALAAGFRAVAPDPEVDPGRRRRLRLRPDAGHGHPRPRPRAGPLGGRARPRRPPRRGTSSSSSRPPSRAPRPAPSGRSSSATRASGAGADFDLAFAPERVNPGDPASSGKLVPRLVGGSTPAATARAAALLANINDTVVQLSSPDAAEMAKLLENVFRNINIAFVNQLALLCERMGLDVWEVIDAAATKPFGFMKFTPGPGVGGHCIPVDPYYLSWRARAFDFTDRFIELAADVNVGMPRHVVDLAAEALNDRSRALSGARVGVLGVAFKPDVADAREAPAADVLALLRERGAEVRFHDPHIARFRDAAGRTDDGVALDDLLGWADLVIIVTPHRAIDWAAVYERADLILDTVNASREGHAAAAPGAPPRSGMELTSIP